MASRRERKSVAINNNAVQHFNLTDEVLRKRRVKRSLECDVLIALGNPTGVTSMNWLYDLAHERCLVELYIAAGAVQPDYRGINQLIE